MGVMVKMHNGDREVFDTATRYRSDPDGCLIVQDDTGELIGLFSPGWAAAFDYPFKKAGDVHVHVNMDGKEIRQAAAEEVNRAFGKVTDSIEKQTG